MKTKFILLLFVYHLINGTYTWCENHKVYNVKIKCPPQAKVGRIFNVEYTLENLSPEQIDKVNFEIGDFEPNVKLAYSRKSESTTVYAWPYNNCSVTWTFTFLALKEGAWSTPAISVFDPEKLELNQTSRTVEITDETTDETEDDPLTSGGLPDESS